VAVNSVVLAVSVKTFDVQLTNVTEGATIGTDDRLRIGILPSDSSIGVFSITPHEVSFFAMNTTSEYGYSECGIFIKLWRYMSCYSSYSQMFYRLHFLALH